ncbi:protein kinase, putative [Plasmodium chabaudi chabaudi]|uniref:Protein kinase, putative n=1 Tax=Plasmodium chabaudi chabaudi TaxID=31271 RepID=A0A4V0K8I6_PLACU|nr:protein kinase, putative [Plasmodium chabaudi chabaudi]VTZ69025.1 protein kinase, putative [Plasmodium chabaudi chabaudi]|eukprot:XP_744011.2 protein kinase, putative [Plasmodium chabaudi chabaudi]
MFQYFVNKLLGDLPPNFNYVIKKKIEYNGIRGGYYDIYDGVSKNNEDVSIFIYEKSNKDFHNNVKKYVNNHLNYSKKLIHPNILKVLYTFDNDKRIYIVTEKCVPLFFENIKGDPIWGIYEVISAVNFINNYNYVHCLINPLSVFVTSKGRWKLSLFDCIYEKNMNIHNIINNIQDHLFFSYGYKLINFSSVAKPVAIDAYGIAYLMVWSYQNYITESQNKEGNMFSMGIENTCFSEGKRDEYFLNGETYKEIKNKYFLNIDIMQIYKNCLPQNLWNIYEVLLQYSVKGIDINFSTILNNDNITGSYIVKTMLFLTEIHMKSRIEKNNFFCNLYENLDNINIDVKVQLILPEICKNLEVSENLEKCLQIILIISKDMNINDFEKMVYPTFLKYFLQTDRSIRYMLLECFPLIEKNLNNNNMNEIYLSYMYGFSDNNISIKNATIKNFIYVYPKLKNNIKTQALHVLLENLKDRDCCIKTNTIICIAKIANYILEDKQNILENVYKIGLCDMYVQIRAATLQAIKATYNQFDIKRFILNIMPLVVKCLIDESPEVREITFELFDFVLPLLKNSVMNIGVNNTDTKKNDDKILVENSLTNEKEANTTYHHGYKFSENNQKKYPQGVINNNFTNVYHIEQAEKNNKTSTIRTTPSNNANQIFNNNTRNENKIDIHKTEDKLKSIKEIEDEILDDFGWDLDFTEDKKNSKKINLNIDDFFDEFDLNNEENTPRFKLSSL